MKHMNFQLLANTSNNRTNLPNVRIQRGFRNISTMPIKLIWFHKWATAYNQKFFFKQVMQRTNDKVVPQRSDLLCAWTFWFLTNISKRILLWRLTICSALTIVLKPVWDIKLTHNALGWNKECHCVEPVLVLCSQSCWTVYIYTYVYSHHGTKETF